MEWNELQSAWQVFKATQKLDLLSENEIEQIIQEDLLRKKRRAHTAIVKYTLAHTLLLFICQSC